MKNDHNKKISTIVIPMLAAASIVLVACETEQTPAPATTQPQKEPADPIRNNDLKIIVNINPTYPVRDVSSAHEVVPRAVVDFLNDEGAADGNTFRIASGEQHNFTFNYTVNADSNYRYTGSLELRGWGRGHITTIYSGEYNYAQPMDVVEALTRRVYGWIHNGWHY